MGYKDFGDFDTAASLFEISIELEPTATAYQNYGLLVRYKLEEIGRAKLLFEKGLALDPENKVVIIQLARIYESDLNDFRQAKVYYDRWIAINPDGKDHYEYTLFLLQSMNPEYWPLAGLHYQLTCQKDISMKDAKIEEILAGRFS
ncbi:tetratricopeptide repeat protein [Pedobacter frigidisoli]|uniref:tetratricopeptide repeat protein n=1 Tax=Pedobacter frigidisoli TaxID=2530455 RepID=UPI002931D409|nr:tetratricopeptide repeat protein [Pedobacter frigidisoli]